MTTTAEISDFVEETNYEEFSGDTIEELKKRVLDSVGIALGAVGERPVEIVRRTVSEAGGNGCSIWASEAQTSPHQAAMMNTTLTRYLDYMDSFLAPGETPHPSDNIASVIACGEYIDASGREILEAVGVAYEVQGELAWNAPVRDHGWDHVTHTVISAATGASKIMGLDREELRNAIGIAGTAHNALRVTRTEGINMWKGIASGNAARNAVYSVLLANNGMEGPKNLFEGRKGWKQTISGEFEVDLDPKCPRVHDVMTKRYVAETYAQSAVEAVIELAEKEDIGAEEVESIHLDTFAGAKLIIGGGEGSRYEVESKAQADHSLPYMLAAALIDREMTNRQYKEIRIQQNDVQELLQKVTVEEDTEFTKRFEEGEMPARVTIETGSETFRTEKSSFKGHPNNPMGWSEIEKKFRDMAGNVYDETKQDRIIETVKHLEERSAGELLEAIG